MMRIWMGRLAWAIVIAAAGLYVVYAWGGGEAASGHEHMHEAAREQLAELLDKLKRLAETVTVMVLTGILVFNLVLLPADGGHAANPAIRWLERMAAAAALYFLIIASTGSSLALVKAVFAILWLLAAWDAIPNAKLSTVMKGLCAVALIPLLHIQGIGAGSMSLQEWITAGASSLHTASVAVWIGGGISIYAALTWKPALPAQQARLLISRFMIGAAAAGCGVGLSGLLRLSAGSGGWTVWNSRPEGILLLLKLLLTLAMVWVVTAGYRRWRRAGDDEMRFRFHFTQCLRFSLSLTVLVLLLSAWISSPAAPGRSVLNEPIYWHVMGTEAHMSLRIREQRGGSQHVRLDVWLPSGTGSPRSAEVALYRDGVKAEVPILYKEGGPDPYGFAGFDKFTYEAVGRYVTEGGSWIMEVFVTDGEGRKHTYENAADIPVNPSLAP